MVAVGHLLVALCCPEEQSLGLLPDPMAAEKVVLDGRDGQIILLGGKKGREVTHIGLKGGEAGG